MVQAKGQNILERKGYPGFRKCLHSQFAGDASIANYAHNLECFTMNGASFGSTHKWAINTFFLKTIKYNSMISTTNKNKLYREIELPECLSVPYILKQTAKVPKATSKWKIFPAGNFILKIFSIPFPTAGGNDRQENVSERQSVAKWRHIRYNQEFGKHEISGMD
ncbi:hypothetical protein CDAR_601241 [Caerostris darwini]|uniref:LAGLIDADG homing endonuclease n=1 Tax=Caerostris darwini TaxID=1538125 RepID=A0AAV4WWE0_9ARAC|nr:hypothetical protein CDAR_601241 [Caerostris darwini]